MFILAPAMKKARKIVAGNWKMNLSLEKALSLFSEIAPMCSEIPDLQVEVLVFPPFPYLYPLQRLSRSSAPILLGAQNCSQWPDGAYTGEVSASILSSIPVQAVLLGHSERRKYFGETDAVILEKCRRALDQRLNVFVCVGESLEERDRGKALDVIARQLEDSVFSLGAEELAHCVIAYEPVWAIGTGRTASAEQVGEMHAHIRQLMNSRYPAPLASSVPILYGGSCNEKNAAELFSIRDVDGGLIGGASLHSRNFLSIIQAANQNG